MAKFLKRCAAACLVLFCAASCSTKETPYSPSQADQEFLKTLREESKAEAIVNRIGQTLWIYIPQKQNILAFKAVEKNSEDSAPKQRKFSIQYLKSAFQDKTLTIEYDIILSIKSLPDDKNLKTDYTEEFSPLYRGAYAAILRSYSSSQNPPLFIVLIFADIQNGIFVQNTFYLDDFKQYQESILPYEEYVQRVLSETKGDTKLIGDETGASLVPQEVLWGDFLAKQITNRIEYKYYRSDFEPGDDAQTEILNIARETLDAYSFKDFSAVELRDVRSGVTRSFGQDVLAGFPDAKF